MLGKAGDYFVYFLIGEQTVPTQELVVFILAVGCLSEGPGLGIFCGVKVIGGDELPGAGHCVLEGLHWLNLAHSLLSALRLNESPCREG